MKFFIYICIYERVKFEKIREIIVVKNKVLNEVWRVEIYKGFQNELVRRKNECYEEVVL